MSALYLSVRPADTAAAQPQGFPQSRDLLPTRTSAPPAAFRLPRARSALRPSRPISFGRKAVPPSVGDARQASWAWPWAIALFVSAVCTLRAAGTPVPGNRPTTTIVRTGRYRFSRNPIYLAFSLLQFGLSLWVNSLALLITLVPAVALMWFGESSPGRSVTSKHDFRRSICHTKLQSVGGSNRGEPVACRRSAQVLFEEFDRSIPGELCRRFVVAGCRLLWKPCCVPG